MHKQLFDFEKLAGYKKSVEFANWVYEITKTFPKYEQFGITSQLQRAAVSISLNIAEGVGRYKYNERRRFYRIARASIYECIPLFEISEKQNYLSQGLKNDARLKCIELAKVINGLVKSLPTDKE